VDRAGFVEELRRRLIGIFRLAADGTRPVLGPIDAGAQSDGTETDGTETDGSEVDRSEVDAAVPAESALLQRDPRWRDRPWFFEYFHGDTGKGLGASHQTGWTALIASLIRNPPSGFPTR
jgi:hypothetical protein